MFHVAKGTPESQGLNQGTQFREKEACEQSARCILTVVRDGKSGDHVGWGRSAQTSLNLVQRFVRQMLRMWQVLNSETGAQVDSQEIKKYSLAFCLPELHKMENLNCAIEELGLGYFVSREAGKDVVHITMN